MNTTELFLVAILLIFTVPWAVWRLARTDYWAPLVVVQIVCGILLGPGILGKAFPEAYGFVFTPPVVAALNGVAWWAVSIFVCLAGIELDLSLAWKNRRESAITAGLALGMPLLFGSVAALVLLTTPGWIGPAASPWQFVAGLGMGCAVTALPILILLMEKLEILRLPIGQRILRYASLDDIAIWGVLALVLLDWERMGRQLGFMLLFVPVSLLYRRFMAWLPESDRWHVALIWLALVALAADWAGLHYMVGAFLAGAVMEARWFDRERLDLLRHHVLLVIMPVFFLSTGLRTQWGVDGLMVFAVAALLLAAAVGGKLAGIHIAGRVQRWAPGEASLVGWLLQTKGLIEIIFASVLLDKKIITSETFTALLLMAVASTMLTVPVVAPRLGRLKALLGKGS